MAGDNTSLSHLSMARALLSDARYPLRELHESAPSACVIDLLLAAPCANLTIAAIERSAGSTEPVVIEAIVDLITQEAASVRQAAIEFADRERWLQPGVIPKPWQTVVGSRITERIAVDPNWQVRRAALRALSPLQDYPASVNIAAGDPHWRVRNEVISLLNRSEPGGDTLRALFHGNTDPRVVGVLAYLTALHGEQTDRLEAAPRHADPEHDAAPFEDPDPNVTARELRRLPVESVSEHLPAIARLMNSPDAVERTAAARLLVRYGGAAEFAALICISGDPRNFGAVDAGEILSRLGRARRQDAVQFIQRLEDAEPCQIAWLLRQAPELISVEDCLETVRQSERFQSDALFVESVLRLAASCGVPLSRIRGEFDLPDLDTATEVEQHLLADVVGRGDEPEQMDAVYSSLLRSTWPGVRADVANWLHQHDRLSPTHIATLARDWSARVRSVPAGVTSHLPEVTDELDDVLHRLQEDNHPGVRMYAMTSARAAQVADRPETEQSWLVFQHACEMSGRREFLSQAPPAAIVPDREAGEETLPPIPVDMPMAQLGHDGPMVSRMGLSGHYHLPTEGFALARDAGINLMFWEPNYDSMTRFMRSQSEAERDSIRIIAGSFKADRRGLMRDVDRILRALKISTIDLFLLYWTRSWRRIDDELTRTLRQLKHTGKVRRYSLSTHNRGLAVEAMERGWDPIMARHSLAHRGAETTVLPAAREHGTSVITFNNLCYGRLLQSFPDIRLPSPAECYWYSLSRPGVTCCLTAPATIEQLRHNLTAAELLKDGVSDGRLEELTKYGDLVYERDKYFDATVRNL